MVVAVGPLVGGGPGTLDVRYPLARDFATSVLSLLSFIVK